MLPKKKTIDFYSIACPIVHGLGLKNWAPLINGSFLDQVVEKQKLGPVWLE